MIVGVILEVAEAVIAIAQIGGDSNGYPNFFARDAAVQGKGGNVLGSHVSECGERDYQDGEHVLECFHFRLCYLLGQR